MKWAKKGLILKPDNNFEWMSHHASMPIADEANRERRSHYIRSSMQNLKTECNGYATT